MARGRPRAACIGAMFLAFPASSAKAETWEPMSRTATAITGTVDFAADRIRFENGSALPLSRVSQRSSFKAGGRTVTAEIYKVSGTGDPVLRRGNRLCGGGQRPTYLAVWDDTTFPGQKTRMMAVFAGGAVPDGDDETCGTFSYVVKAGASQLLAAKTPGKKAEIPARFRGVWAFVAQRTSECRASEWKGIAASDESLVSIGPTSFVAFESGCDVTGSKRSEDLPDEGPTTLTFTCSGEGSTETVRENWQIIRHKGDELLVTSAIGKPRIVAYKRCQ